jgi:hypothetical protein
MADKCMLYVAALDDDWLLSIAEKVPEITGCNDKENNPFTITHLLHMLQPSVEERCDLKKKRNQRLLFSLHFYREECEAWC